MYRQTDRKSAIIEIQKYLYVLSDRKYKEIPRVPIDGVFDAETAYAVRKFQEIKLLPTSDKVDLETFTALYEDYREVVNEFYTTDYILGDGTLPLFETNQNEDVRALHLIINELRKSYPQIKDVGTGAYFSRRTGDAVEYLRELFGLEKSRRVDKKLYARMLLELKAQNRLLKKSMPVKKIAFGE